MTRSRRRSLIRSIGRAREATAEVERAYRRLERLFEISTLLTQFETIERTVQQVLAVLADAVGARLGILLLEGGDPDRFREIAWSREGLTAGEIETARARARTAYGYLLRPGGALQVEAMPARSRRVGFVQLPLVVDHRRIFGALHVEGAGLEEADLAFVNSAVNQLAIALDRAAVIDARQAETEARRAAAEVAASEAEREGQAQRLLADISARLAASLDYRQTLDAVVGSVVPSFADACFIDGPDGENLATALGDRSDESGVFTTMTVPLVARGRSVGTLTFASKIPDRRYSAREQAQGEEIGRRAALAIDNALLYESAQRAIAARQHVLAVVSHDLRNPLGSILVTAALLSERSASGSPQHQAAARIERSATRMDRLIGDLLDGASIEAGHLTIERACFQGADLVCESVDQQEAEAARRGVRLRSELLGAPFELECDHDRVLQVLGNLIGNAIKFTPSGGTVDVRVRRLGEDALFSVEDSGPGIPPDEVPHIFERYWQASRTARLRTGLGLSIAQGIVRAHRGRIWVESTSGEGTTMCFTIPLKA